jgi:hypothetical protein
MDLLEKFAQKKKKTLILTNVGKRVVGYYIPIEKEGGLYIRRF